MESVIFPLPHVVRTFKCVGVQVEGEDKAQVSVRKSKRVVGFLRRRKIRSENKFFCIEWLTDTRVNVIFFHSVDRILFK